MIIYDRGSPETHWYPFIKWMQDQGLDPVRIRRLTLFPRIMQATVIEYDLDQNGLKYLDPKTKRPALTYRRIGYTEDPPKIGGTADESPIQS